MKARAFLFTVALAPGALPALSGAAGGQELLEELSVSGHRVVVAAGAEGTQTLAVDDAPVLTAGVVLLDPLPLDVNGVAVVTGVAGPGGNACAAAPFVLALPRDGAPELAGPLDTCEEMTMRAGPSALVFTGIATPLEPAEVWVWAPGSGFAAAAPQPFAPDPSLTWDDLSALADLHPMEALRLGEVAAQLEAGLGADWPAFAERIAGLGSGELTDEGWLGESCLKESCDDDWALLYLHTRSRSTFAAWAVDGQPRVFPPDPGLWPAEAAAALAAHGGP